MTKKIAIFIPSLAGGGAERALVNFLKSMTDSDLGAGITWDLVLAAAEGPYMPQVPASVNVIDLKVGQVSKAILPLASYLRREKPAILISHMGHTNIAAIAATKLSFVKTRLVLVEHNSMTSRPKLLRARVVPFLMKRLYPQADAVIAVSRDMKKQLVNRLGLSEQKVHSIPNPVVSDYLRHQANEAADHPWLASGEDIPVFLNVGRLDAQKDQAQLLKAFAQVRAQQPARLIILGEGDKRAELEQLATELGITKHLSMPGFANNPYSYMSKATAFVLSSQWEGLPTVLIEAMACGCRVISTDCPTGPAEILEEGEYGTLVPVGDLQGLSAAMLAMAEAADKETLKERLKTKADCFSFQTVAAEFLELFRQLEGELEDQRDTEVLV